MILDSAYVSVKSGQEVGSVVKYLIGHPDEERAFELLLGPTPIAERSETFGVFLVADPAPEITTLANGQELVRCGTRQGKAVDILFSPAHERNFLPCYVFLEE